VAKNNRELVTFSLSAGNADNANNATEGGGIWKVSGFY
jgi:hypothetical protein